MINMKICQELLFNHFSNSYLEILISPRYLYFSYFPVILCFKLCFDVIYRISIYSTVDRIHCPQYLNDLNLSIMVVVTSDKYFTTPSVGFGDKANQNTGSPLESGYELGQSGYVVYLYHLLATLPIGIRGEMHHHNAIQLTPN